MSSHTVLQRVGIRAKVDAWGFFLQIFLL